LIKIYRFEHECRILWGILEEENLRPISGSIFEKFRIGKKKIPISRVRVLAPVEPTKIVGIGRNYRAHSREMGNPVPKEPLLFLKPPSAVIGPNEVVITPEMSKRVDYEGELAVIIGKGGKYVKADQALEYVGGVTCFNDVSERRLHIWDRPEDRPWDRFFDWLNGKWWDNFAPMGPCAVPIGDMGDIQNLRLVTRLNGEVMQEASTADMIFSVARIIEYISHMITLEPGDVIATGTPSGVGSARGIAMKPGDTIEVEIEGIGILSNPVVAEGSV